MQYLAGEAGVDQFLDIGSGLPTQKNTHQAAQEVNSNAKVVYVDVDPIVLAHGRALLATDDSTIVVTADLREPQSILDNEEIKQHLDFSRPVVLMIYGIHMHFHDDEKPDEWVRTLMNALPSGSYLFISDFVDTGEPLQKAMEQAGLESLGNGWIRTPERIEQHFLGMPLIPPGLDFLARWNPVGPGRRRPRRRGPPAVPAHPDGWDRQEGLTPSRTPKGARPSWSRAFRVVGGRRQAIGCADCDAVYRVPAQ